MSDFKSQSSRDGYKDEYMKYYKELVATNPIPSNSSTTQWSRFSKRPIRRDIPFLPSSFINENEKSSRFSKRSVGRAEMNINAGPNQRVPVAIVLRPVPKPQGGNIPETVPVGKLANNWRDAVRLWEKANVSTRVPQAPTDNGTSRNTPRVPRIVRKTMDQSALSPPSALPMTIRYVTKKMPAPEEPTPNLPVEEAPKSVLGRQLLPRPILGRNLSTPKPILRNKRLEVIREEPEDHSETEVVDLGRPSQPRMWINHNAREHKGYLV
ncbi:uncharacterized protein LOC126749205 [Anthonomus grandis grandis]|uniref:uncharacterized protein LOC126749205 n=1 Tax=Anthonomus grandis grandis TaxID=2921223 RepID=UPI002165B609|nr:uncharacterized protein LOC126749205 [Anthonomus grandis grandis]XP_050314851.1 uncharacterized protein LOC126749205 [Anthonomus grandis grandis]XP_050314852.1 uncharacterized protein LOC126749205 [Anthonomus grandis grandis]XP_050314853.1 uncharacterized protein LOC126749205 [Anthonomus grandis grandis]